MIPLRWFVFREDINTKTIRCLDIFDHTGFQKDFCGITRRCKDKESFAEEVRRSLMYYFWSKCEWETLICPWPFHPDKDSCMKVDPYWQIKMNWDVFIEYVWEHRKEVKGASL